MQYIPYQASADPRQYYAQGLGNLFGGFLGKSQRGMQAQDLSNLALYMSSGMKSFPNLRTQFGQQLAASLMGRMAQPTTPSQMLNQLKYNFLQGQPPEQMNDILLRMLTKPEVGINLGTSPWYTDPKLTGEETPARIAGEEVRRKTQPTQAERKSFRDEAVKVIGSMPKILGGLGFKGFKNITKDTVNSAYERYLANTGYSTANEDYKRAIRESWYSLMKQIKAAGFQGSGWDIGKNEVDWNPNDPKVKKLESGKQTKVPEEPKTQTEFVNTVRRLNMTNPKTAREYYDKYVDKLW